MGAQNLYLVALFILREDFLGNLGVVLADECTCRLYNCLGGAVVLLQLEEFGIRVQLGELEHVVQICATERVDALGIVTYHTYLGTVTGKLPYYAVLGVVGILILINQNVFERCTVTFQHIRMVTEKYERIEQQVIKIHCVTLAAALLIALVNLAHHGYALKLVMLVDIGILNISRCRYQTVLGIADTVLDHAGLIGLVIQLHILDNGFYQVLAVLLVIDGKVGCITDKRSLRPQNPAENAVESTHPEITGTVLSHSRRYALFHLSCRLVGKGERQY